ncbi:hypothetical protein FACS1894158_13890 [Betaproteobacteria bacterium]|nr:hypothetical protein FACS1894158_13890 [Betaproteobacteria bacterium]
MQNNRPIVVDLDGTLINSDMLVENLFLFLRLYPWRFFLVLAWLLKGKACLKRNLADAVLPEVYTLPYNQSLIAWLKTQRAHGRRLVLATASDRRIAERIAAHVGLFDEILGTDDVNLASRAKRKVLVERYGEKGYEYVGNSTADLAVWASAALVHIANPGWGVLNKARRLGEIGSVFNAPPPRISTLAQSVAHSSMGKECAGLRAAAGFAPSSGRPLAVRGHHRFFCVRRLRVQRVPAQRPARFTG